MGWDGLRVGQNICPDKTGWIRGIGWMDRGLFAFTTWERIESLRTFVSWISTSFSGIKQTWGRDINLWSGYGNFFFLLRLGGIPGFGLGIGNGFGIGDG